MDPIGGGLNKGLGQLAGGISHGLGEVGKVLDHNSQQLLNVLNPRSKGDSGSKTSGANYSRSKQKGKGGSAAGMMGKSKERLARREGLKVRK